MKFFTQLKYLYKYRKSRNQLLEVMMAAQTASMKCVAFTPMILPGQEWIAYTDSLDAVDHYLHLMEDAEEREKTLSSLIRGNGNIAKMVKEDSMSIKAGWLACANNYATVAARIAFTGTFQTDRLKESLQKLADKVNNLYPPPKQGDK